MKEDMIKKLGQKVENLEEQNEALACKVNITLDKLNNSRVNFSQSCHRESRSCTSDIADNDYSLDCHTGELSINRTVSSWLVN